jgi:quercetin dioxygenase-like cupin family protein
MIKTSFGHLDPILKINDKVVAEYLIFENEGRNHFHKEFESFTVLSGTGQVVCDNKHIDVKPGDTVTIPPNTSHRMIPDKGHTLTGLLWYHEKVGELYQFNKLI